MYFIIVQIVLSHVAVVHFLYDGSFGLYNIHDIQCNNIPKNILYLLNLCYANNTNHIIKVSPS